MVAIIEFYRINVFTLFKFIPCRLHAQVDLFFACSTYLSTEVADSPSFYENKVKLLAP